MLKKLLRKILLPFVFILKYFIENAGSFDPNVIATFKGYRQFEVVYNSVAQKLFFGNKSSGFTEASFVNTWITPPAALPYKSLGNAVE